MTICAHMNTRISGLATLWRSGKLRESEALVQLVPIRPSTKPTLAEPLWGHKYPYKTGFKQIKLAHKSYTSA
jgi:hypothetical protein